MPIQGFTIDGLMMFGSDSDGEPLVMAVPWYFPAEWIQDRIDEGSWKPGCFAGEDITVTPPVEFLPAEWRTLFSGEKNGA
jgi:hypothetical protein